MAGRHAPRDPTTEPCRPGRRRSRDLHTHTRRSDGVLEPAELVRQAHAAGVRLFAIADHDTLAGYRELTAPGAARCRTGWTLVPAVEINAVTRDLGLMRGRAAHPRVRHGPGRRGVRGGARRPARRTAPPVRPTVERLREIGLPVDGHLPEGVMESDDALGRPTLARALIAAGHAASVEDAFRRILGPRLPGLRAADRARPGRGDPGDPGRRRPRVARPLPGGARSALPLLRELIERGPRRPGDLTTARSTAETLEASRRGRATLGLVATGGTDYHGDLGPYAGDAMPALGDARRAASPALRAALRTRGSAGSSLTNVGRSSTGASRVGACAPRG